MGQKFYFQNLKLCESFFQNPFFFFGSKSKPSQSFFYKHKVYLKKYQVDLTTYLQHIFHFFRHSKISIFVQYTDNFFKNFRFCKVYLTFFLGVCGASSNPYHTTTNIHLPFNFLPLILSINYLINRLINYSITYLRDYLIAGLTYISSGVRQLKKIKLYDILVKLFN